MNPEFQKMRGASTWAKKVAALVSKAPPNHALPLMISAEVLVAPTIIQKNGKIDRKAATLSRT